jgi:arylsulfatase
MIDHQVGEIMKTLDERGYLDNALVIFTSDHGDALGDHGHIQKWTMYDCSVRVPLIMWSRNLLGHKRNDSLVQLMDIAPTVLEAAGLQPPAAFEARSLWPVLKGERDEIRTEVYSELARDHIQTGRLSTTSANRSASSMTWSRTPVSCAISGRCPSTPGAKTRW